MYLHFSLIVRLGWAWYGGGEHVLKFKLANWDPVHFEQSQVMVGWDEYIKAYECGLIRPDV